MKQGLGLRNNHLRLRANQEKIIGTHEAIMQLRNKHLKFRVAQEKRTSCT